MKSKKQKKKVNVDLWYLDKPEELPTEEEYWKLRNSLKSGLASVKAKRQTEGLPSGNPVSLSMISRAIDAMEKLFPYFFKQLRKMDGDQVTTYFVLSEACIYDRQFPSVEEKMEEWMHQYAAIFLLENLKEHKDLLHALDDVETSTNYYFTDEHLTISTRRINQMITLLQRNPKDKTGKLLLKEMLETLDETLLDDILRKYHHNWTTILVTVANAAADEMTKAREEIVEKYGFDPVDAFGDIYQEQYIDHNPPCSDVGNFYEENKRRNEILDALEELQSKTHQASGLFLQLILGIMRGKTAKEDVLGLYDTYRENIIPMTETEYFAAEYFISYFGLPYKDFPLLRALLFEEAKIRRTEELYWADPWNEEYRHPVETLDERNLSCDLTYCAYLSELEVGEKPTEEDYQAWLEEENTERDVVKICRRQVLSFLGLRMLPSKMTVDEGVYQFLIHLGYTKEAAEDLAVMAEFENLLNPNDCNYSTTSSFSEEEEEDSEDETDTKIEEIVVQTDEEKALKTELRQVKKELVRLQHALKEKEDGVLSLQEKLKESNSELQMLKEGLLQEGEDEELSETEDDS
ncbi:MAG: hypothetical protein KBS81_04905, partial [Spirochaetales bacterium]|nr:hypothetical protein [Candidatus Physcosoma equi]